MDLLKKQTINDVRNFVINKKHIFQKLTVFYYNILLKHTYTLLQKQKRFIKTACLNKNKILIKM